MSPNSSSNVVVSPLFLGQSGEFWDYWMLCALAATVVAALAVAICTAGSVIAHKREAAALKIELDRKDKETEGKVADASSAASHAAVAAFGAGKKAGHAETLIANAQVEIAKQRTLTAQAQLETERMKRELGWRNVNAGQIRTLRRLLRGTDIRINIYWIAGDPEGSHFAQRLNEALRVAGAAVIACQPVGMLAQEEHGLKLMGSNIEDMKNLAKAFDAAGIGQVDIQPIPPPKNQAADGRELTLYVGYRSAPELSFSE